MNIYVLLILVINVMNDVSSFTINNHFTSVKYSIDTKQYNKTSILTLNATRNRNKTNKISSNQSSNPSTNEDETATLTSSSSPSSRRKKKNKYSNFSKTNQQQQDPLDTLITESQQKLKEINKKQAKTQNVAIPLDMLDKEEIDKIKNEKRDRNKRFFPDVNTINPYDPSTYGYIELGTVQGAHGVHGLVKVIASTDFPERLCKPGLKHIKYPNRRSPREIRLLEGRLCMQNEYLVKFENIGDRDSANKLRGCSLYVLESDRPDDIADDEFMVMDLIDLEVKLVTGYDEENSLSGNFVGRVYGVVPAEEMCSIPGLGHDLLEIILPRGNNGIASWRDEMVLIPFVPSIVPTIDLERGVVYIDPPSGLLDLTYVKEETVRIKGFLPPAKDP